MKLIQLTLLTLFSFFGYSLSGQVQGERAFVSIGVSSIPLHIDRTDLTRWMIFPSIDVGYKLNENIFIHATYLYQDLRSFHFDDEESHKYTEAPHLNSFELASQYIGDKVFLSLFTDYIFIGMLHEYTYSDYFNLRSGVDLGYRFGETYILDEIFENGFAPYGYDGRLSIQNSDSPGLKMFISPRLLLWRFLSLEAYVGSYIFINWPVVQPFGSMQIGFLF